MTPAQLTAPTGASASTQGIAAVVTTLQLASDATTLFVEPTEATGLQDPLLAGAAAGASFVRQTGPTDWRIGTQADTEDLFSGLVSLSRGRKLPVA
jgi:hypothetical protein